jgi:WW domain-binding protein 4
LIYISFTLGFVIPFFALVDPVVFLQMTSFWKSNPRYYCKVCSIYVDDNAKSRRLHDEGKRHAEQLERKQFETNKKKQREAKQQSDIERQLQLIEKQA